jgi:hypothetical protein
MKIQKEEDEKLRLQRKQEEKDRWWAGVEVYKPNVKNRISTSSDHVDGSVDNGVTNSSSAINKGSTMDVVNRYTADYSRWNDWIPTDDASKAEIGKDRTSSDDDDDDNNNDDDDDNDNDDDDVMLTIVRLKQ